MAGKALKNRFGLPLEVTVSCPVYPSEDPAKVLAAVDLVFGTEARTRISASGGRLEASYVGEECLSKVYEQVRSHMTVSVLRRLLRMRLEGNSARFFLNKQVAARGVVVLCESEAESPLGGICVSVHSPQLGQFIDWISPNLRRRRRSFRKG